MTASTPPVFLVDSLPAGEHAVLDGQEGRHAATVRRLRAGEEVMLSDGRGAVAGCVVESAGRDTLALRLVRRWVEPPPRLRLVVAQALVKGERGELAVELATEAGADAVVPWRAARSVTRWDDGQRGARALGRWRGSAREAAKQARRAWVPEVAEPVDTSGLAALVLASAGAVVLEGSAEVALTEARLPDAGDLVVIVGPEGGTSEDELALLTMAGAQPVRLGPHVLRASTAAAIAISVIAVVSGRWR